MSSETEIKVRSKFNAQILRIIYYLTLLCIGSIVFLSLPLGCSGQASHSHGGHGHSHGGHADVEEPPSFKYSPEANAQRQREHVKVEPPPKKELDRTELWTQALSATFLISVAPFFILFFVPLDATKEKEPLLKILLSFASGGLLGDAFLHLIPHALMGQNHDNYGSSHSEGGHHGHSHGHHGHSHGGEGVNDRVGVWVLAGILLFLFVDKFVRLLNSGHSHSHGPSANDDKKKEKKDDKGGKKKAEGSDKKSKENEVKGEIQITGYLNLVADMTHNFTDGLAIGASFLAGKGVGYMTTLTILLHEVPHEIGDFAILIKSGCTRKKAMYLQLLTALGAFSGTVVSLLVEGYDEEATFWILPMTAGGFIYIATVSVLPELLADTTLVQSIKEIIALLVGVGMMVLIAGYE